MAAYPIDLPGEIWKQSREHSWLYASSLGRLKSESRLTISKRKDGDREHVQGGCLYKEEDLRSGYKRISFSHEGKVCHLLSHRVVCGAFHGEPPTGKGCVRHLNGIRTDNRPENLWWGSHKENWADRHLHGTAIAGEDHGGAKVTAEQVALIRSSSRHAKHRRVLAEKLGVTASTIYQIQTRRTWQHI